MLEDAKEECPFMLSQRSRNDVIVMERRETCRGDTTF